MPLSMVSCLLIRLTYFSRKVGLSRGQQNLSMSFFDVVALRADVRSFLAVEPNTPPDAEEDDGRNEDLDEDDELEDHCG